MSTYVVGDIQGCLQPLKCLLKQVNFDPSADVLWSVGDIVNRGPKCLKTLRFLYRMRNSLQMVLGNHDLHLLAVAAGVRPPSKSDTLNKILAAPDREELLNWLLHRPLIHHEHGYTMVHAGIPPQWSIKKAKKRAREVEEVLRSEHCLAFFQQMYGNEPTQLALELTGMDRWRVITNYFTRLRFCAADGSMELITKTDIAPPGYAPWFEFPRQEASRILFGHWAAIEGKTSSKQFVALDTGCVWGRELSALRLEDNKLFSVPARSGQ